jgi:hypothetical protein
MDNPHERLWFAVIVYKEAPYHDGGPLAKGLAYALQIQQIVGVEFLVKASGQGGKLRECGRGVVG